MDLNPKFSFSRLSPLGALSFRVFLSAQKERRRKKSSDIEKQKLSTSCDTCLEKSKTCSTYFFNFLCGKKVEQRIRQGAGREKENFGFKSIAAEKLTDPKFGLSPCPSPLDPPPLGGRGVRFLPPRMSFVRGRKWIHLRRNGVPSFGSCGVLGKGKDNSAVGNKRPDPATRRKKKNTPRPPSPEPERNESVRKETSRAVFLIFRFFNRRRYHPQYDPLADDRRRYRGGLPDFCQ